MRLSADERLIFRHNEPTATRSNHPPHRPGKDHGSDNYRVQVLAAAPAQRDDRGCHDHRCAGVEHPDAVTLVPRCQAPGSAPATQCCGPDGCLRKAGRSIVTGQLTPQSVILLLRKAVEPITSQVRSDQLFFRVGRDLADALAFVVASWMAASGDRPRAPVRCRNSMTSSRRAPVSTADSRCCGHPSVAARSDWEMPAASRASRSRVTRRL